jgi:hypothetical protein
MDKNSPLWKITIPSKHGAATKSEVQSENHRNQDDDIEMQFSDVSQNRSLYVKKHHSYYTHDNLSAPRSQSYTPVKSHSRKLVGRTDYQMTISKNSYEDILFYEKKALNLDKLNDYLRTNAFNIDMQMNLGEFLYKIMPANIYDKDLENIMTPDDQPSGTGHLGLMPASRPERQSIFNLDKFRVSVRPDDDLNKQTGGKHPEVHLNLVTATALLEETMALIERCKHYEKELAKRDLIIRRAIVNYCYDDANTGERRSSFIRSKGEINDDVKSMLVGEVPRLILSEYESCHFKNRQLEE